MASVKNILKNIYSHSVVAKNGTSYRIFPTAVNSKEGEFLATIVNQRRPKWIIEVGLGYGVSALWVESGPFHSAKHIVVDPWQNQYGDIGKSHIQRARCKNIIVIAKTSQEYLISILKKSFQSVDMIVIDGDEKFDYTTVDIFLATKLLRIGGILIVRNVWNPAVRKSLMFYIKNLPYKMHALGSVHQRIVQVSFFGELYFRFLCKKYYQGFCALEKIGVDNRPWDHFINF